ncbi:UNVERIFIED_CONTAM: hypothetical protein FKN15_010461 [Acipenser sinensis]
MLQGPCRHNSANLKPNADQTHLVSVQKYAKGSFFVRSAKKINKKHHVLKARETASNS